MKKLIVSLCILLLSPCSLMAAESRPNILLVLTDDLGYADVGFNGATDIQTPSLDALAEGGTKFTSAYNVHPFCGPSRAGLMTGRYPHKFGAQFNLPTSSRSGGLGVPTDELFISKVLQDAGYYTGVIGKWHLGQAEPYHPNNRGFDEFYGFLNGGHHYLPEKFSEMYSRQANQGLEHDIFQYLRPLERNGVEVDETEYVTDGLSREAVKFIEAAAKKPQQPFFLYLAYNAPHTPMQAKAEDMAKFSNIKDRKRQVYAAMVYAVDRGMKQVVDSLKATGQFEDTLIVFLSDNGGKPSTGASNSPLMGKKGDVTEGGYRTPMFFHWPQQITSGETYTHPVTTLDFFPTFASIANAPISPSKQLDGKDIFQAVKSLQPARQGEMIYAVRHRKGYSEIAGRKDNFKAINTKGSWQLFDVDKDPGETKDISKQYPMVLREMLAEMEAWSWTHTQPRWFHIHKEGFEWREASMPRFHESFPPPAG
ncbi:sulfatase-like hydrolase/transferase [Shewanella sp. 5_MG-2023]|uniref:sulfatase family protein n=1 Tax=unclassified Shewanella TaxID=196818 RepID=UPI000C851050|nr:MULTISPECIES: sulfatase-like hydrolase/transferase [unclassified Shewanella]MDO6641880.1 sulfatase-like hydrolase/transferase [Shewanella sp. 5_MG-2023]PMH99856.1 sulfatase [Shewanella sp. 10N.286.48.A6]